MDNFFLKGDDSRPVIRAIDQVNDEQHGGEMPPFPKNAVIYCYNYGLKFLKERHGATTWIPKLPRFLSGCEVLKIEAYPDFCFLHGGAGAPMIADTLETLIALGVENFYLLGLCGVFSENIEVGDVVIPSRVLSEEGTSRHYFSEVDFVEANQSLQQKAYQNLKQHFTTHFKPTVTSDAIFRQTFNKEAYWRQRECVGVDMEASAFLSLCQYYNKNGTIMLLASDKHPLTQNEEWCFGKTDFLKCRQDFTEFTLKFILHTI